MENPLAQMDKRRKLTVKRWGALKTLIEALKNILSENTKNKII
jgi:hypothetical protein